MKRFVLFGLVMLLTLAVGISANRLIHYRPGNEVASVAQLPPAELNVLPVPATPGIPIATIAAESHTSDSDSRLRS
jgi:hypothetical protein